MSMIFMYFSGTNFYDNCEAVFSWWVLIFAIFRKPRLIGITTFSMFSLFFVCLLNCMQSTSGCKTQ